MKMLALVGLLYLCSLLLKLVKFLLYFINEVKQTGKLVSKVLAVHIVHVSRKHLSQQASQLPPEDRKRPNFKF